MYDILNDAIYCVFVAVIAYIAAKMSKWLTSKIFSSKNKIVLKNPSKAGTIKSVTSNVLKVAIYFIAIFTILNKIGVSGDALVAVSGSIAVAIGLGAQNLVSDVLAGIFVIVEEQFNVGDIVEIAGCTGAVEKVTMRTTTIRGIDGTVYIVPNGSITTITNKCKDYMNALVDVGIAYEEDIDHVIEVLKDEMSIVFKEVKGLLAEPEVLGIVGLDDSAVTIRILAKCEIKLNYSIEREIRLYIKRRLDKENISIPFPQRTVHLINEKQVTSEKQGE